jgi:hypothetical protein
MKRASAHIFLLTLFFLPFFLFVYDTKQRFSTSLYWENIVIEHSSLRFTIMSDPSSSTSRPSAPPKQTIRTIPPLVLLSFAVIHSQVYWLYSVFYHLCNNLPDRSLDPSVNDTVRNALTKGSGGRARAFSEPQQASTILIHRRQTTTASGIAATAATTTTKRRPRSK